MEKGEAKNENQAQLIIMVFIFMALGGVFREISKKTKIPYTPMLFVAGQIIGYVSTQTPEYKYISESIENINPESILLCFLPILIFDGAQNINFHQFNRQIVQILILGVPCVAISAFFIMISIKVFLAYDDKYYTYISAFLMGSILSCTDTAAVVALLKEVGAPQKFRSLIEGESLINDASCMILIMISVNIIKGNSNGIFEILANFLSLSLGGIVIGIIFGSIATLWIKKIYFDSVLITNITVVFSYLVFYVAEHIEINGNKFSGIISVVTFGLFMSIFGKNNLQTTEAIDALETFWQYITYCAETVIFFLAGCIMGVKVLSRFNIYDDSFYKLFALYLLMMLSRFLSIMVFYRILKKHGYGFSLKDAVVLTYGGIRGAIGISFSLIVTNDSYFDENFKQILLLHISICAFLTLIINASTTSLLIKVVGMVKFSTIKENKNIVVTQKVINLIENQIEKSKQNEFLNCVDWNLVKQKNNVQLYQDQIKKLQQNIEDFQKNSKNSYQMKEFKTNELKIKFEDLLDNEMVHEARYQFLQALKNVYMIQINQNRITSDTFLMLMSSVNMNLDEIGTRMDSWDYISSGLLQHWWVKILFQMRNYPILGKYATLLMHNHIFRAFEVTISFIQAHKDAEQIFLESEFQGEIQNFVIQESEDLRSAASLYLQNSLWNQYPEIIRLVQLKVASITLLEQQQDHLHERMKLGQLAENDYEFFKTKMVQSLKKINNMVPDMDEKTPIEFLKQVQMFKMLPQETLNLIAAESEEMIFQEDSIIIKEYDLIKGIYLIIRGTGTESSSVSGVNYKEKKGKFDAISLHSLCTQHHRYQTNFVANGIVITMFIKESTLKTFIQDDLFMEYIWSNSLYALSRIYPMQFIPMNQADKSQFSQILPNITYQKFQKGQQVLLDYGGILLKGTCIANQTDDFKLPEISEQQELKDENESNGPIQQNELNAYMIFQQQAKITCQTSCYIGLFTPSMSGIFAEIKQKFNKSQNSRQLERKTSILSNKRSSSQI